MDTKRLLGLRIKELRKAKNITQERLAELVDIEPTTISNIECGRNFPNLATLEKITEILNSNFSDVFNFQHCDDKNIVRRRINDYLVTADDDEIEFVYKIIQSLIQYKFR